MICRQFPWVFLGLILARRGRFSDLSKPKVRKRCEQNPPSFVSGRTDYPPDEQRDEALSRPKARNCNRGLQGRSVVVGISRRAPVHLLSKRAICLSLNCPQNSKDLAV